MTALVDARMAITVTAPGRYDISDEMYHADPVAGGSLSQSGARTLLRCPAKFQHEREHGRPPKREWDIGHAAHLIVLGEGPELVRVDAQEWRSDKVKAEVAEARAQGKVPLRPSDWDIVHAMARVLAKDRLASALLRSGSGRAEQTLVWQDDATGVWCRARADWLRDSGDLVDYKTTTDASPAGFNRSVAKLGYHIQRAHYTDGVRALGLAEAPRFVFIAQEKEPPYVVTCAQLDDEYAALGAAAIGRAREIFRDCTESGYWPGYLTDDFATLSPPRWLAYQGEIDLD